MSRRRHFVKSHAPEPAGDLVARILTRAGLGEQVYRLDIFRRWAEAVGPKIAQRTAPQAFSRGTLIVRAASSTWQNELMFLRGAIIAKLNGLLGAPRVKELKVISGHLPPRQAPVPHVVLPPQPEHVRTARDCAMAIADPEVREAFVQAMALNLGTAPSPPPDL